MLITIGWLKKLGKEERLTVSEQAAQKFDVERFSLRKLNELEVRKQYQIEISKKFAAMENLSDKEDRALKRMPQPQLKRG
jgi:cell division inhibitor SulA